ncbi:hypothetical protein [Limimaricola hongkongensis]|uniref:Uncharacterized protein n=1 Tax=Limimaricola hongkongensis DSM 17492 TaxID=1122180 RepID=A0A017HH89_9RHOB|nr:hypothetical protein [Limimaricola hongkongensis]EYD73149.1 hypothetical protein Lokhon_00675 [Limimaricola hongkongensis DSM 17492]
MQFSVQFDTPRDTGDDSGPALVGWCLTETKGGIIYAPPERVRSVDLDRRHAKSASRCPAVINLESRYFLIRCPFDIHVGFERDDKGRPALRNLSGTASAIRGSKLGEKLRIVSEPEWRHAGVPTLQLSLPYLFLSDARVYLSQVAPFMHYTPAPLPGTIFGGRFPINVWPRPLMWAFEWHEPSKPLKIARGDPLFYAGFETTPQERGIAMVEAQRTPELLDYLDLISGAVSYVSQTFSLFEAAEARRPETLVTPVARRPRQG